MNGQDWRKVDFGQWHTAVFLFKIPEMSIESGRIFTENPDSSQIFRMWLRTVAWNSASVTFVLALYSIIATVVVIIIIIMIIISSSSSNSSSSFIVD